MDEGPLNSSVLSSRKISLQLMKTTREISSEKNNIQSEEPLGVVLSGESSDRYSYQCINDIIKKDS